MDVGTRSTWRDEAVSRSLISGQNNAGHVSVVGSPPVVALSAAGAPDRTRIEINQPVLVRPILAVLCPNAVQPHPNRRKNPGGRTRGTGPAGPQYHHGVNPQTSTRTLCTLWPTSQALVEKGCIKQNCQRNAQLLH